MPDSSKDHGSRCGFVFSDGRRCTMPESPEDMGLCYFHAKKYADAIRKKCAGHEISRCLNSDINTACDLNAAFTMLFSATAQNFIKPRTAHVLTNLGHLMLQTHLLAKEEYLSAFTQKWPEVVQQSLVFNPEDDQVIPFPEPPKTDSDASNAPDPAPTEQHTETDPDPTPTRPPTKIM
jgi:hypothetical protein